MIYKRQGPVKSAQKNVLIFNGKEGEFNMDTSPYSLKGHQLDSTQYYKTVAYLSNNIMINILSDGSLYLDDFMKFIHDNHIEHIRSREEYGIEFLMIGVMLQDYIAYGRGFCPKKIYIFNLLNNLRQREILKEKVDTIRGKLISSVLIKRKNKEHSIGFKDFNLTLMWMKATGDFKEEIIRLGNWAKFLQLKDDKYIEKLFHMAITKSRYLYEKCEKYLGQYIEKVSIYLEYSLNKHKKKEDFFYCGKGKNQYFFNMISAEVMNKVYRTEFLDTKEKKVFLPACMRQVAKKCSSKKSPNGYICLGCSKNCNVNELTELGKKMNFQVYVIPHESMLLSSSIIENSSVGIIGVACILNLMSGGWKALRLGFKPQCIVLDYCGCSSHWLDRPIMTSINIYRIIEILN